MAFLRSWRNNGPENLKQTLKRYHASCPGTIEEQPSTVLPSMRSLQLQAWQWWAPDSLRGLWLRLKIIKQVTMKECKKTSNSRSPNHNTSLKSLARCDSTKLHVQKVAWISCSLNDDEGWDLAEAKRVLQIEENPLSSLCRIQYSSFDWDNFRRLFYMRVLL